MTGTARFTLTISDLDLSAAQNLSDVIDRDIRLTPQAIAISETSEGRWGLTAYFESRAEAENARTALAQGAVIAAVPEMDWVRQSLEGLPPVQAGRFFVHGSHDRYRRKMGGVSLEVDAGTAFGTGHHGTTEGCLLALDAIIKKRSPKRILDVGCGTGVLAIAAAKAAKTTALASDIDPEAVRVTKHNARMNGVASTVAAITAGGLKHPRIGAAPYDLIFANILARPLVSLAQGLSRIIASRGSLILSGLTLDQCRWVYAAYRNRGLVLVRAIVRGNWATLVLTRPRISGTANGAKPNRCGWRLRRRRPALWRG